ncbi:thiamine phosphate synthase [Flexivirga endophytica]|uniref:Thiamine phosphate synthase n=1 Tax=Flexivirga endophytica TaxID=1849103 RepID=A0A916T7W2_9MICO|nr:thiamine phosphate synthase [Flexivirga endophytica]GGB34977.1 thiamine phosphate synthase [Flexivirga endophytica]GHB42824.1 thiamine phosphate synthase [Flexivirga endophytica]
MTAVPRLLLITDRTQTVGRPLEAVVAPCVSAGISHVLLRERDLSPTRYDELLARVRACVDEDTVILTRTARSDSAGCHLSHDAPWPTRACALTGRSVHNSDEVQQARINGADFVVVGPYAATTSKPGYGPPLGAPGVRALAADAGNLPVLAVGGVRPTDLDQLAVAGAAGAAVMGALMRAPDPRSLALEYLSAATVFMTSTNSKEQQ